MCVRTVAEVMTPDPVVVEPGESVERAIAIANERKIHHLVFQRDSGVVCVVCLSELVGDRPPVGDLRQVPRHPTIVVGPDDRLDDAAALMSRERIGCLPVVRDGEVVGVLTRRDLARAGQPFDAALEIGVGD